MDAVSPFRCLWVAALLALAGGCQSPTSKVARPQMPSDPPGPLAPAAPPAPPATPVSRPAVLGKPVVGLPLEAVSTTSASSAPIPPPAPSASSASSAPIPPPAPATAIQTAFTVPRNDKTPSLQSQVPTGDPRIKIVAFVGATNIVTDEEVWEACRQRSFEYIKRSDGPDQRPTQFVDEARKKAVYQEELRRTIERELILDEMYLKLKGAKKSNAIEDIKEFASKAADRKLREFKKTTRARSDDEFKLILLSQGLTAPVIHRQVERQLMADEYVRSMLKEKNHGLSLAEIRDYYDRHPKEFSTEDTVKWLDIFILFNKFPSKRAAYDYARAIQLHAAAGEDFVNLSRIYDHGLSGQVNGLGLGNKRGEIQPAELEPAVWSLEAGQVSRLIETPAGYHIIKIAERQHATLKPFDVKVQTECRRKLLQELQRVEYRKLVEKLWRSGVVKLTTPP